MLLFIIYAILLVFMQVLVVLAPRYSGTGTQHLQAGLKGTKSKKAKKPPTIQLASGGVADRLRKTLADRKAAQGGSSSQ